MLGLGMPRKVVGEQRTVIEEMADNRRPIDEGALLDVAGALLYVEASLDDHIERLGAGGESEDSAEGELELPKAEVRKILDALMREAAVNIQQAKHDIIAFIESPWEHARVEQIPRLLEEISGALRMLGLADAAQLMTGIVRFVETELLQHRRVPTAEQMDKLADALAAIEYYLEATREQRGNRERILDVTRESLEALGYWPVPSGGGGPGSGIAPTAPMPSHDVAPPATDAGPDLRRCGRARRRRVARLQHRNLARDAVARPRPRPEVASFDPPPSSFRAGAIICRPAAATACAKAPIRRRAMPICPTWICRASILPDLDIDLGASEWSGESADARASNDAAHDGAGGVEIVPGRDIGDLIVGEAIEPERSAHDLAGLRFAETNEIEPGWTEIEEEIEEEVPVEHAHDAGFHSMSSGDIDDEIREVFVEEVQEEIENMQRNLPLWKADVENLEALKPIRRSFHTLKGSGRLVGAMTLGEFSWKVENMLNRVLDRTVAPSHAAVSLVEHAIGALPELLAALRGGPAPSANVHGIMTTADRIANGEEAHVPVRAATRKIRRVVRRRVPIAAPPAAAEDFDIESAFSAAPPEVQAGPTPNIDPVLFDILKSEVAQHLGVIGDYLDRSAPTPVVASETLLRAVHTLNGAIAMVDIPALGHVLAPLEGYIKRLRGIAAAPDADGITALEDTVSLARDVVQRLDMRIGELPDSSDLVLRVTALRDALPEPETSLHLYSGAEPEPIEIVPAPVAVDDALFGTVDEEIALAADEIERHYTTPAVAADDDLTESLIRSFDGHETETAAPFAEMPAELASSLSNFDLEHPAPPAAEAPPIVAQDESVEPSFGSSATLVDAALFAAFDEAGAEPEPANVYSETLETSVPASAMTPVEDEADLYVPDDEVPAVAFEADDVDDFSEIESLADAEEDVESLEAEVAMPIEDEAAPAPVQAARVTPIAEAPVSRLTGAEAAPIAEDPQPDGPLELRGHGRRPARHLRAGRRRHSRSLRFADGAFARSAGRSRPHRQSAARPAYAQGRRAHGRSRADRRPEPRDGIADRPRQRRPSSDGSRRGRIARARLRPPACARAARRAAPGDRDADERDRTFRKPGRRRGAAGRRFCVRRRIDRTGRHIRCERFRVAGAFRRGAQGAERSAARAAHAADVRRRRPAARAAGNDPRALGAARLAGELRRRSLDLPLASRAADLDLPLQPDRVRADRRASSRAAAQARDRNRSADHRALPARASRDGHADVRSTRARSLLAAAAAVARARRVGLRSCVDSGPARRPDAPVRNAAAAAVARQLGSAGRPHAHAHGAVRFAGAEPAPHAAPGRAGSRQARTAARRWCAGRNGPQPARAHEGAVRAHAAQRAGARHRSAR